MGKGGGEERGRYMSTDASPTDMRELAKNLRIFRHSALVIKGLVRKFDMERLESVLDHRRQWEIQ